MAIANSFNMNAAYGDPGNMTATTLTIQTFICPSEVRSDREYNGTFGVVGPTNYGFCLGDWFVFAAPDGGPLPCCAFGAEHEPRLGRLHRRHEQHAPDVRSEELASKHS